MKKKNLIIFIYHIQQKKYSTNNQTIILSTENEPNFNVLKYFNQEIEKYKFECGIFIDRQQFIQARPNFNPMQKDSQFKVTDPLS